MIFVRRADSDSWENFTIGGTLGSYGPFNTNKTPLALGLISTLVIMFPIRTAGMVWFNLDDSLPSSDKAVALTASRAVSMFTLLWYEFLARHFDNSLNSWIIWLATLSRAIPRLSSSSLVATILINLDALPRNKTKEATPTPKRTNRSGPKFWESFL